MPRAEVSSAIRLRGATASDVADALWNRRVLVKTYGPRGTVHILPANELALWTAALNAAARDDSRRHELLGLKRGDIRAIVEAIGDALDGEQLTREELGAEVARRGGRAGRHPARGELSTSPRQTSLRSGPRHSTRPRVTTRDVTSFSG